MAHPNGEPAGAEALTGSEIRSALEGPRFSRFLAEPRGDFPVGLLSPEVREWLGAETSLVILSDHIMNKQHGQWTKKREGGGHRYSGHDELAAADYSLLPDLIERPQVVMRYRPWWPELTAEELALRLNLLSEVNGRYLNVVVARPLNEPNRVELITFHSVGRKYHRICRMMNRAASGEDGQRLFRDRLPAPPESR